MSKHTSKYIEGLNQIVVSIQILVYIIRKKLKYDRTFDGNAVHFPSWWKRFLAFATMSDFKEVLKEESDKNLPDREVSDEDEEKDQQNNGS